MMQTLLLTILVGNNRLKINYIIHVEIQSSLNFSVILKEQELNSKSLS